MEVRWRKQGGFPSNLGNLRIHSGVELARGREGPGKPWRAALAAGSSAKELRVIKYIFCLLAFRTQLHAGT